MPASPLVSVDWLASAGADPGVRVVDVRWYLGGPRGEDAYLAGHIPGAAFLDVDRDLAAPRGSGPGRHPIPSTEAFAAALRRVGVGAATIVVAYDDAGGAIAARLWWLLRYFGHGGGRVLDGGVQAWTARGFPLSRDVPSFAPPPLLDLAPQRARVVDKLEVARLAASPRALVLDARATERYEGRVEPIDARAGHVPGARSAPFVENLVAPGGAFRGEAELRDRYAALGAGEAERVVCYCGSGVTACHDLLALALAGRDDALLYEGSWSDWAADPALGIETGSKSRDNGGEKE